MRMQFRSLLAAVLLAALLPAGAAAARPAAPPQAGAAAAGAAQAAVPAGTTQGRATGRPAFVPGRVLVGFRPGVTTARRGALLRAVGAHLAAGRGEVQIGTLARTADVPAAARRLAAQPGVAWAEPDWIRRFNACGAGVDCWHLAAAPGVNALAAHAAGKKGSGAVVAVIDSGVANIAELGARVTQRRACNASGACAPTGASDSIGHGTSVASLIAAADNGVGITGVAPEATIKAWKVDDGEGGIPVSAEAAALQEAAADSSVKVVNLSLGGSQPSTPERNAINAVLSAGKSIAAASGNDGNYLPHYPAGYPGVVSVGATTKGGGVATFSSYGKLDVVAPGEAVTAVAPNGALVEVDGTSFASPIVAGILALGPTSSRLRSRLAVEGTADTGAVSSTDAKVEGHGLANANAYVQSFESGASPFVVAETHGPAILTDAVSGQLANPSTIFDAYVLKSDGSLASPPGSGTASFSVGGSPVASGRTLQPLGGGVFGAVSGPVTLARGATRVGTATLDGASGSGSVPVRVLRANDQAPGVPLLGTTGDDLWNRGGTLDGGGDGQAADDNVDDVYAVYLAAGDTLDATLTRQSGPGFDAVLYTPGTTDVFSQFGRIVACASSPPSPFCRSTMHLQARVAGTYLIDVFALGSDFGPTEGGYRLTWTVRNVSGVPVTVPVGACSPNGDHIQDVCAWNVGNLPGYTAKSFLTSGFASFLTFDGPGAKSWNGTVGGVAKPDGTYTLRVLYTLGPGKRSLLRTFPLILDRVRPKVANLSVAPNPFEPVPRDGDRDTTTFAISSNERSRLRVLVYKYGTTTLVRTISTGLQPAGRQRVSWNGRTLAGTQLRGRYVFRMQIIDPAGNFYLTGRYVIRIL
ncbi:MAG TPA: S8 family serine peptidase [Actinomycetes bacterium]|nr:S8 family serine peptidase [Actinomycetes bacterium]